jgi:7,8-dihydropterin-6-yl-methyl-4-(beta-D-ribofuranosyl)aminobenzene 5'-phosphate synthase
MGIFLKISETVSLIALVFFIKTLIKLSVNRSRVQREIAENKVQKIPSIGSVKSLTILPLIDYYADAPDLKTEAGVAYYITADDTRILLDLGANGKKEHPSPLLHNANRLGLKLEDLDFIYISHAHLDHLGGMKEQKEGTFSVSAGPVSLPDIPVYAPVEIRPSDNNPGPRPEMLTEARVIKDGIVSIGAMPRALYLLGYTLENTLAFNVEGKGIVLVIGCGHQTVERIIERAKTLFDEPIHAIIGGLHLPVGGGRMNIGPVNVQRLVGSDQPPWNVMGEKAVVSALNAVQSVSPSLVALSPHDSSDASLDRFRAVLGDVFQVIKVGCPITV